MNQEDVVQRARGYFLREDNQYGCAETAFITLKEVFELPHARDSAAAMALNGGIAYSGGVCGALSGSALALGLLAGQRIGDHKQAKRVTRLLVARTMERFVAARGSGNCRELTGLELQDEDQHRKFIESGIWRTTCMQGIEFAVKELAGLADEETWQRVIQEALE